MRLVDVRELVDLRLPAADRTTRVLSRMHAVADFERVALRRLPAPVAGYLAGGADREETLRRNSRVFTEFSLVPRVGVAVSSTSTDTAVLGTDWSVPFGFSPTGYTRMFAPRGELAVAQAAARLGVPYVISTMATTSPTRLAQESGLDLSRIWFQLYALKDRDLTARLLERVQRSGIRVLEIAVDAAVAGNRLRDHRTGFTVPPRLSAATVLDIGMRPRYWMSMLRSPKLGFANFDGLGGGLTPGSIDAINDQFDPDLTWEALDWIRRQWSGPVLLKGLFDAEDARQALSIGMAGVHLSNHGGRQLDLGCSPIDLLPQTRAALGPEATIIIDSGVRTGSDVAIALALGADAAFVGRPYLWGLAVAETAGVQRVGEVLRDELVRTMQLLGLPSVRELRSRGAAGVHRGGVHVDE